MSKWPRPIRPCKHCGCTRSIRVRGLCSPYYYNPAIRHRYPSECAQWQRDRLPDFFHAAPLPEEPTRHLPGTKQKLLVLAERFQCGQQLFHPCDAPYEEELCPLTT